MSEMLYKLYTVAVMTGKELQKNCVPQSFMNIIFQIETRKSGKQFVPHKSGKIGRLRPVLLIHYD